MPRQLTGIEQQMVLETDVSLAFLMKPSALVLKDDWIELMANHWGESVHHIMNCPHMQALIKRADIQMNVIKVVYGFGGAILDGVGKVVLIPPICFKKNISTEPYMQGE